MSDTLCKSKDLLKRDFESYVSMIHKPKFVCTSCGRVANQKSLLCKPIKITKVLRPQVKK